MTDRTHRDPNAKVRAIVDDTIADLLMIGMASRDSATSLMAIQAMIRIEGLEERRSIIRFAHTLIGDDE